MKNKVPKKMLLGFMQIHVLIQAKKEPFFGLGMIGELKKLDYDLSPGTLYPLLAKMEQEDLLKMDIRLINGKNRHYYSITKNGIEVLEVAKTKAMILFNELNEV
ncbi:MAG: helix-turn-helix transcriptional regulator [Spirochaetaceae bacterium]|nr:helix-turn-helix transcriptional regulator [Spirochaetaceae bacterium]